MGERRHGKATRGGLDDSSRILIGGVVEALAGIHRAKQAQREETERRPRRGAPDEEAPSVTIDDDATASSFFFDLARLQLRMLDEALKLQRRHADFLFRRYQRTRAQPAADGGGGGTGLLVLKGALPAESSAAAAHDASAAFVIENRSARSVRVALRLLELRSRDGRPPFVPRARFEPGCALDLGPDQELPVKLVLTLDRSHYKPGHRYRGSVEILMSGRARQTLAVRVDVAHEAGPEGGAR
ncbi:hypothetical protein WMF26_26120 [Sorangium sp. So ce185]|uniref:hypothetical protein n=1 Tax=Sorangium sp. So ce185 TaxID=3133287 RepID=UPI003F5EDC86